MKNLAQESVLNNQASTTMLIVDDGLEDMTNDSVGSKISEGKAYSDQGRGGKLISYLPEILMIKKVDIEAVISSVEACRYQCYFSFDHFGDFVGIETDVEREQKIEALFEDDLPNSFKKRLDWTQET